jgi:hypothetical protein
MDTLPCLAGLLLMLMMMTCHWSLDTHSSDDCKLRLGTVHVLARMQVGKGMAAVIHYQDGDSTQTVDKLCSVGQQKPQLSQG